MHCELEEKVAALQSMLIRLVGEQTKEKRYLVPDKKGDSCALIKESHKKRKMTHITEVMLHKCNDSDDHANLAITNALANESFDLCKDKKGDCLLSNQVIDPNSGDVSEMDTMKLLCLNNMTGEEILCLARIDRFHQPFQISIFIIWK